MEWVGARARGRMHGVVFLMSPAATCHLVSSTLPFPVQSSSPSFPSCLANLSAVLVLLLVHVPLIHRSATQVCHPNPAANPTPAPTHTLAPHPNSYSLPSSPNPPTHPSHTRLCSCPPLSCSAAQTTSSACGRCTQRFPWSAPREYSPKASWTLHGSPAALPSLHAPTTAL